MTEWYDCIRWERRSRPPKTIVFDIERTINCDIKRGHFAGDVPLKVMGISFVPVISAVVPLSRPDQEFSELTVEFDFGPEPDGYSIEKWWDENREKIIREINDPVG